MIIKRDQNGWKIKTRFVTFHPVSYGTATLARFSIGLTPSGRRLMLHYFPKSDYASTYHDHPWSFRTLVLWGKYVDWSINTAGDHCYDVLVMGSTRRRSAYHRHKTKVLRRTMTLVLTSPDERGWCEGSETDWKCEGTPEHFLETLGHIPDYEAPVVV